MKDENNESHPTCGGTNHSMRCKPKRSARTNKTMTSHDKRGGFINMTTTSSEFDTSTTNYMLKGSKPKDFELLVASTIVKEVR